MKCEKCGAELDENTKLKFCSRCGAELPPPEKKKLKTICIIVGILSAVILCLIFKYKMLILLGILAIIAATFMINRKILKMRNRDEKNSVEKQYTLSDAEVQKFSGYFVNQEEKYLSSLGNGYIMNYFANGSLSRGFAVISDKRVYFRGSCFTGSGKTLRRSDEERTVDIKDVTGSGFIYQRYLGILLGLFTAFAVLLSGIAGSIALSGSLFSRLSYSQEQEQNAKNRLKNAEDLIEQSGSLEADIESAKQALETLQAKLGELNEKCATEISQSLAANMNRADLENILYGSELDTAYQQYLCKLMDIISEGTPIKDWISQLGHIVRNSSDVSYVYYDTDCQNWADAVQYYADAEEDSIGTYDNIENGNLYFAASLAGKTHFNQNEVSNSKGMNLSPEDFLAGWCALSDDMLWYTYQCHWLDQDNRVDSLYYLYYIYYVSGLGNDYLNLGFSDLIDQCRYGDHIKELIDPIRDDFDKAYDEFIAATVPGLAENASLEEMVAYYLKLNPNASFGPYFADALSMETSYDEEIDTVSKQISQVQESIHDLEQKQQQASETAENIENYRRSYDAYQRDTFREFIMMLGSSGLVALLLTFSISCFLVFLNYLKKRKTFFEIQYAGGRIAFDVSYYAKAEIEDFQKQLRRAKDFVSVRIPATEKTAAAPQTAESTQASNVPEDLRKYAELLKEGLISQEEYDAMKKKLLGL